MYLFGETEKNYESLGQLAGNVADIQTKYLQNTMYVVFMTVLLHLPALSYLSS